jgi:uncharacterized membrane protein
LFETLFKLRLEDFLRGEWRRLSAIPVEAYILGFVAFGVLAWFLYRRAFARVSRRAGRTLLGLRVAQLAVAFFILTIPAVKLLSDHWGGRKDAVVVAVLVDSSRSMSIRDVQTAGGDKTRLDAAFDILEDPGAGLLKGLGERAKVMLYGFSRGANRVEDARRLSPVGGQTNVSASLKDMEAELRGAPLAAAVLITDGCRNAGGSLEDAAGLLKNRVLFDAPPGAEKSGATGRRLPDVPLYVVGLGSPDPPRDYEVVRVVAPRQVRKNSEAEIVATIRHTGFHGAFQVNVSRGNSVLLSQTFVPDDANSDVKRVRLAFTPDIEGSATYRVSVPPDANKAEQLVENNHRDFGLGIRDDRLPVLYIEGSPRLEYRFLRRALFRDNDFRVVGMLRLGKDAQGKERFYIQGAGEAETYLAQGFPDSPERLFAFQAVILGDIEAGHFTAKQLKMLEEFVRVRGGGLLMLGGVNSFGLGKYADTPVGKMLPVEVASSDPAYSDEQYNAKINRLGLDHPVMRLKPDPVANAAEWKKAPPLIGITPVRGVKGDAMLLVSSEKGDKPVLAVRDHGEGRVAAFTSGGSWYWRVSVPSENEFHEKFWKQMVRWLAVGAKQQVSAEAKPEIVDRGQPVIVEARVLDANFCPVNTASVVAELTDPYGAHKVLPMRWTRSEEGVYQCQHDPNEEGDYKVSVRVEGWNIKPAATGFQVTESFIEYSDAGLKERQLRAMAERAGGRYFGYAESRDLLSAVLQNVKDIRDRAAKPRDEQIWDMPAMFGALLCLLAAEWFIRRRSGLA